MAPVTQTAGPVKLQVTAPVTQSNVSVQPRHLDS
jgi:hypothetical protein